MPTEVVYDVYQDRKGFIWISTEQGLFRYDGKNYQNYALDEQTSNQVLVSAKINMEEFGIAILMVIFIL